MLKMSKHAQIRSQQRSLPRSVIDTIIDHGRLLYSREGTYKVFLGNKEYVTIVNQLRTTLRNLDRAKGGTVVIGADRIITVYKQF